MSPELTRIAIIPGLVIIIYIYSKDKVEKEPIGLILKLILYGSLCCFVAGTAEQIISNYVPSFPVGSLGEAATEAFLVAGFCEELTKYLALRIGSWRHPAFNYHFDGIVYGVSVAVGFALLENLMYVSQYGLTTAIARAFTAVPLHAMCGIVMGILYSYSKKASKRGNHLISLFFSMLAWILPMIIHGIYDTLAMLRTQATSILLIIFVVILFVTLLKKVNKMSDMDQYSRL